MDPGAVLQAERRPHPLDVRGQRIGEVLPQRPGVGLEELLDVGDLGLARALAAGERVLAGEQLVEGHEHGLAPLAIGGIGGGADHRDLGAAQGRHEDLLQHALLPALVVVARDEVRQVGPLGLDGGLEGLGVRHALVAHGARQLGQDLAVLLEARWA